MVDKANCNCIYGRCEQIAAKNDEIERLRAELADANNSFGSQTANWPGLAGRIEDLKTASRKQAQRIASLEEAIKPVLAAATPLDDPEPHWCQVRIDDLEALEEAIAKEQDDRLSGERDQSVEGRDALNNDSALPAPDSKAKEQDDMISFEEGGIGSVEYIEEQDDEPCSWPDCDCDAGNCAVITSKCKGYEPVDSYDDTGQTAADPDKCRNCGEGPHDDT